MNLKRYNKISVIGRGGFGRVSLLGNIGMENRKQERQEDLRLKRDGQS